MQQRRPMCRRRRPSAATGAAIADHAAMHPPRRRRQRRGRRSWTLRRTIRQATAIRRIQSRRNHLAIRRTRPLLSAAKASRMPAHGAAADVGRRAQSKRRPPVMRRRLRSRRRRHADRVRANAGAGFREWGRGPAVNSRLHVKRTPILREGRGPGARDSVAARSKGVPTGCRGMPRRQSAGRDRDRGVHAGRELSAATAVLATGVNGAGADPASRSGGAAGAETRQEGRSSNDSMRASRSSIAGSRT
jgi:hypothetical protein